MSFFGDLETFATEELYPYRWPITVGFVVATIVMVAVALRLGVHRALWRRRLLTAAVGVPLLAVILPIGWYSLSPLWERSRLDEASPLAASAAVDATATSPAAATPASVVSTHAAAGSTPAAAVRTPVPAAFTARVVNRGRFDGADDFHFGRGDALLIETQPGRYTLRFENFSVRNGPDLFVYLTRDPESVSGAINLGDLKATDGNFNYEVPPGTDVAQYRYAIVWCRQFATLFASAPLDPA